MMYEPLTGIDLMNIMTIVVLITMTIILLIAKAINKRPNVTIRRLLSLLLATTTVVIYFSIILLVAIVLYIHLIK